MFCSSRVFERDGGAVALLLAVMDSKTDIGSFYDLPVPRINRKISGTTNDNFGSPLSIKGFAPE